MTEPGWFPDPEGRDELRWWDGSRWTEHRAPVPSPTAPTEALPVVPAERPAAVEPRPPFYLRRPWQVGTAVAIAAVIALIVAVVLTSPGKHGPVSLNPVTGTTTTTTGLALQPLAPVPTGPAAPTTSTAPPPTTAPPTTSPATTAPVSVPPTSPPTSPAPPTTTDLCGAPPNPMGYNFCQRGSQIFQPDPRTCSYFSCSPTFFAGRGYMVECDDGLYTLSGGRGDCSNHGGVRQTVYSGP